MGFFDTPEELARRARFKPRQSFSEKELYASFFAKSDVSFETAIGLLRNLASAIGVSTGVLRPTDGRYDILAVPEPSWDDGVELLFQTAEVDLRRRGVEEPLETIRDFVELYGRSIETTRH